MHADLLSIAAAQRAAETAAGAFERFLGTDPVRIDAMVDAMADAVARETEPLAALAVEETGYGRAPDKREQLLLTAHTAAETLRGITTLGLIWRDDATRIAAFGKPLGVIAAFVPATNPVVAIVFKVLSAIKAGNAIICAPDPKAMRSGMQTVRILARVAESLGAPSGLIQCLEDSAPAGTRELMRHPRTALIWASGAADAIRAAYASGKPAMVHEGTNTACYVHRSMRESLEDVAGMILASKSFDHGLTDGCEQAVVADAAIAEALRDAMAAQGAYFCSAQEAERLARVLFLDDGAVHPDWIGRSPQALAAAAGFKVPASVRCLVSSHQAVGWHCPLSARKWHPVLAFYETGPLEQAIARVQEIAGFDSVMPAAVVHAHDAQVLARFTAALPVQVLVNAPAVTAGLGQALDGTPAVMLGTGAGGEDMAAAHRLVSIERVAYHSRSWRAVSAEHGL